jgi:pantothenate synthetase
LRPAPTSGAARLLVAGRVGSARLIDNVAVTLP